MTSQITLNDIRLQQTQQLQLLKSKGWHALQPREPDTPTIYIDFRVQRLEPYENNELYNKIMLKFERFGYCITSHNDDERVWFFPWDGKNLENFIEWLDLMDVEFFKHF